VTHDAATRATDATDAHSYPIQLARRSNGGGTIWVAAVEELPGCEASATTPAAAAAAAEAAIEGWLRAAAADGREIPPPGAAAAHSGRLLVRMPRSLHGDLVRASEREGTSLNSYIVAALSAAVGWRREGAPRTDEAAAVAPAPSDSPALARALLVNVIVLAIVALVAVGLLLAALL
jgi:antitoxin HicB